MRELVVDWVLATPPELPAAASPPQRTRVHAMVGNILPVSAHSAGLRSDTAVGKHLAPAPTESIQAPALVVSARDERYGTYASATYTASGIAGLSFIGFDQGGHAGVGLGLGAVAVGTAIYVMGGFGGASDAVGTESKALYRYTPP